MYLNKLHKFSHIHVIFILKTMDINLKNLLLEHESILEEIKSRKKQRGMDFYIPNAVQYKAHQSKAKTIVIVKGNRMGGTTWGAMETAFAITKKYPDWFPVERRFPKKALKIRIATDKFFKIDSVIEPKLRDFLPEEEIVRVRRSPQGYISKLNTQDGSVVEFLTSEQDQMAWEGQDLDFFWGDEPMKRNHWVATKRGLIDRSGKAILTFTPLIEPWMKDEIVDKADGKEIEVVYGTMKDNLFDISGNPILSQDDIEAFERILTEDEKQTRIYGKFFHLKGLVYKELCPSVHFLNDFKYEEGFPVICVLDPHDRLPHHVIWAMVDRINDIYVMYELVKEGTTAQLASMILATEKFFGWRVVKRLIDPNFGRKPLLSTGLSVIQELAKNRCYFTEADDNKEMGHLKVKEMLHFNQDKPVDINNKPKLFFVKDRTSKTIHSLLHYQYDEWRMNAEKDPKEDTKAKDCHGADSVRYLCISQPQFSIPAVYEPHEVYY